MKSKTQDSQGALPQFEKENLSLHQIKSERGLKHNGEP